MLEVKVYNTPDFCWSWLSAKLHWTKNTSQPKTYEEPNPIDIKSVITEHPKSLHKLSKSLRQAGKVDSNSPLCSDIKKTEMSLKEKNVKIRKQEHAFKGLADTYNIEILNYFDMNYNLKILNLQLKVSE